MGLSTPLSGGVAAVGLFPDAPFSKLGNAALEATNVAPANCRLSRGRFALGADGDKSLARLARIFRFLPHRGFGLRILDRSFKRRNLFLVKVRERQLLPVPQLRNLLDGVGSFFFFDPCIAAPIQRLRGKRQAAA